MRINEPGMKAGRQWAKCLAKKAELKRLTQFVVEIITEVSPLKRWISNTRRYSAYTPFEVVASVIRPKLTDDEFGTNAFWIECCGSNMRYGNDAFLLAFIEEAFAEAAVTRKRVAA